MHPPLLLSQEHDVTLDGSVLWAFSFLKDAQGAPGRSAGERCSAGEEVSMIPCGGGDREVGQLQDGSFSDHGCRPASGPDPYHAY